MHLSIRFMLCCCFVLSLLTACGEQTAAPASASAAASKPAAPKKPQIALVMKTQSNPFFVSMEKGARRAENELGVELLVRSASSETSIEHQILLIDELIDQKVDAIVIAPADSTRLVPALKRAQQAGIKLVNIDNQLSKEALERAQMPVVPFISVDNEDASYRAVKYLLKDVKGPVQMGILEGIRSAENASARLQGAQRAIAEKPQVKLVASESANWKIDEAYQQTERIFKKHPGITVMFCANDMMALGALKYLQDKGRKDVLIGAYDGVEDVRLAIRDGKIAVSVDQQAAQQGYQGIKLALQLLQGKPAAPVTMVDALLLHAN